MTPVLLIDDDERLAGPLAEYLARFNLQLTAAAHPRRGLQLLKREKFALVILDVMLPERDGFDVCREIRRDNEIPIIMLTARGEVTDRVVGLELGADDYLAKPFEPRELVARIQNILKRRAGTRAQGVLRFDDLLIDRQAQSVTLRDKKINLTDGEYRLLLLLASSPGENFSRDDILNQLKGVDAELFTRSVDIQISRLRQKLKPMDCIKTVWGSGYSFVARDARD